MKKAEFPSNKMEKLTKIANMNLKKINGKYWDSAFRTLFNIKK
jgi:hypothetical protein